MKTQSSSQGFTLLETMIALALLSILALASSRSIQGSLRSKKQIQGKIDRQSLVRDGLTVMKRDIEKAFHYFDFHVELYNESYKERISRCEANRNKSTSNNTGTGTDTDTGSSSSTPSSTQNANTPDPCAKLKEDFKEKKQTVLTHFVGDNDSLHFTTKSNIRPSLDSPQSDLAEVGYYLDSCKSRITRKSVSQCLWRRSSAYIDDDVTKDGKKMVLIENIDRFELKYLGPGKQENEWVKNWFTNEKGDAVTKDAFPFAVEITLGVKEKIKNSSKGKKFAMTVVAPIRFPNNIKKEREAQKVQEAEAAKAAGTSGTTSNSQTQQGGTN